jgi:hypothetical protein
MAKVDFQTQDGGQSCMLTTGKKREIVETLIVLSF